MKGVFRICQHARQHHADHPIAQPVSVRVLPAQVMYYFGVAHMLRSLTWTQTSLLRGGKAARAGPAQCVATPSLRG